jgi:hypothetical protein
MLQELLRSHPVLRRPPRQLRAVEHAQVLRLVVLRHALPVLRVRLGHVLHLLLQGRVCV